MKITLLCDNKDSWIIKYLDEIYNKLISLGHEVFKVSNYKDIKEGELCFLLSCENIMPAKYLKLNKHNLVIHESDLPKGKGWSPLTWQILEGKNEIPITLFEAEAKVDTGLIYLQDKIEFEGYELNKELKHKQGLKTKELILGFVKQYPEILNKGRQPKGKSTYYPKRSPDDSEIDIDKTIREQFNLLRVVDNERYPAFFKINGEKYYLKIYKED